MLGRCSKPRGQASAGLVVTMMQFAGASLKRRSTSDGTPSTPPPAPTVASLLGSHSPTPRMETAEMAEARQLKDYSTAMALHAAGCADDDKSKLDEAVRIYLDIPSSLKLLDPSKAQHLKYLCFKNAATIYAKYGDDEEALRLFMAAAAIDGSDGMTWRNMYSSARRVNDMQLCRAAAQRALDCSPRSVAIWTASCEILFLCGDFCACQTAINKVEELSGSRSPWGDVLRYQMALEDGLPTALPSDLTARYGAKLELLLTERGRFREKWGRSIATTRPWKRRDVRLTIEELSWEGVGRAIRSVLDALEEQDPAWMLDESGVIVTFPEPSACQTLPSLDDSGACAPPVGLMADKALESESGGALQSQRESSQHEAQTAQAPTRRSSRVKEQEQKSCFEGDNQRCIASDWQEIMEDSIFAFSPEHAVLLSRLRGGDAAPPPDTKSAIAARFSDRLEVDSRFETTMVSQFCRQTMEENAKHGFKLIDVCRLFVAALLVAPYDVPRGAVRQLLRLHEDFGCHFENDIILWPDVEGDKAPWFIDDVGASSSDPVAALLWAELYMDAAVAYSDEAEIANRKKNMKRKRSDIDKEKYDSVEYLSRYKARCRYFVNLASSRLARKLQSVEGGPGGDAVVVIRVRIQWLLSRLEAIDGNVDASYAALLLCHTLLQVGSVQSGDDRLRLHLCIYDNYVSLPVVERRLEALLYARRALAVHSAFSAASAMEGAPRLDLLKHILGDVVDVMNSSVPQVDAALSSSQPDLLSILFSCCEELVVNSTEETTHIIAAVTHLIPVIREQLRVCLEEKVMLSVAKPAATTATLAGASAGLPSSIVLSRASMMTSDVKLFKSVSQLRAMLTRPAQWIWNSLMLDLFGLLAIIAELAYRLKFTSLLFDSCMNLIVLSILQSNDSSHAPYMKGRHYARTLKLVDWAHQILAEHQACCDLDGVFMKFVVNFLQDKAWQTFPFKGLDESDGEASDGVDDSDALDYAVEEMYQNELVQVYYCIAGVNIMNGCSVRPHTCKPTTLFQSRCFVLDFFLQLKPRLDRFKKKDSEKPIKLIYRMYRDLPGHDVCPARAPIEAYLNPQLSFEDVCLPSQIFSLARIRPSVVDSVSADEVELYQYIYLAKAKRVYDQVNENVAVKEETWSHKVNKAIALFSKAAIVCPGDKQVWLLIADLNRKLKNFYSDFPSVRGDGGCQLVVVARCLHVILTPQEAEDTSHVDSAFTRGLALAGISAYTERRCLKHSPANTNRASSVAFCNAMQLAVTALRSDGHRIFDGLADGDVPDMVRFLSTLSLAAFNHIRQRHPTEWFSLYMCGRSMKKVGVPVLTWLPLLVEAARLCPKNEAEYEPMFRVTVERLKLLLGHDAGYILDSDVLAYVCHMKGLEDVPSCNMPLSGGGDSSVVNATSVERAIHDCVQLLRQFVGTGKAAPKLRVSYRASYWVACALLPAAVYRQLQDLRHNFYFANASLPTQLISSNLRLVEGAPQSVQRAYDEICPLFFSGGGDKKIWRIWRSFQWHGDADLWCVVMRADKNELWRFKAILLLVSGMYNLGDAKTMEQFGDKICRDWSNSSRDECVKKVMRLLTMSFFRQIVTNEGRLYGSSEVQPPVQWLLKLWKLTKAATSDNERRDYEQEMAKAYALFNRPSGFQQLPSPFNVESELGVASMNDAIVAAYTFCQQAFGKRDKLKLGATGTAVERVNALTRKSVANEESPVEAIAAKEASDRISVSSGDDDVILE